MVVLEIISTLFVFIGVFLIAVPKIQGYYFMSVAQVGWTVFGVINNHNFLMIQSVVLLLFNFYGIYNWRKKKVG